MVNAKPDAPIAGLRSMTHAVQVPLRWIEEAEARRVLTVFECAPCQPPKKSRTKAARPSFDRVAKGVLKPLAEGQLSHGGTALQ
jgi:hypothetical protein